MISKFKFWIPLAITITAFCGLVYLSVQQNIRQSANDPQIQMSEDLADALENGGSPDSLIPKTNVDISKSLAPFVIVFNDKAEVVISSVILNGKTPTPPSGVFDFVRKNNKESFTWEPNPGIRIAASVIKYNGAKPGFVLAGRSIREVEKRESSLEKQVLGAWLATLVASMVATLIFINKPRT